MMEPEDNRQCTETVLAAADRVETGIGKPPAGPHYRTFIGPPETYDIYSHMQFTLLTLLGLRQDHTMLDIGCGSLRAGKLFMMYLLPEKYCGIEPEQWLVEEGIRRELGREFVERRKPRFEYSRDFPCGAFGIKFDFILAHSIFSHASTGQITHCLTEAKAAMRSTSIFAASFLEGDEDYAGTEWKYPECIRFRATTIESLARKAGLESKRLEWFHIGGQTWSIFFLPGLEPQIEVLASLNQSAAILEEMKHYRMRNYRLERIERHPLYRLMVNLRTTLSRR